MNTKLLLLVKLMFFLTVSTFGNRIEIEGVYQGKNLFVQNELITKKIRCITNIYVNDKHLLDHPKQSIIEVDLSSFKVGEKIKVRIYHKDSCIPEVLNGKVISENHFSFVSINITEDEIHWEAKGELDIGKYVVQQKLNDKWEDIKFLKGQSYTSNTNYTVLSDHTAGLNEYRIKYRGTGGFSKYSDVITYESSKSVVTFYPTRVTDVITFISDDKRSVNYKVYSLNGRKLITGTGVNINCSNLEKGKYYKLFYDNKESNFYMKE